MNEQVVCVVDAGATWSKGAIVEVGERVEVLAVESGRPGNPNVVGDTMAESNLSGLLLGLHLRAGRDPRETDGVCIGSSTPRCAARAAGLVLPGLSPVCVSDVELLLVGQRRPTVAVVAGTGSMAVRSDGGDPAFAGGHGWFLGDEGGAAWIGRAALQRVLDGSATSELTEQVAEVAGAPVGDAAALRTRLYEWLYRDGAAQRQAACLAVRVGELAVHGDTSCVEVIEASVAALVELACELAQPGDTVVFGGSVAVGIEPWLVEAAERAGLARVQVRADGVPGAVLLAAGRDDPALLDEVTQQWLAARATLSPPWAR